MVTPACTTLSHAEFRVLVLLAAQFTGHNNGALGVTRSQGAAQGIGSDHTLYGALKNLEVHGLIERTCHASRTPPRPAMYCISWESEDDTDWSSSALRATHAYRDWQPPAKQKSRRGGKRQRKKKARPKLTVVGNEP